MEQNINVIKPKEGFSFKMPSFKFHPIVLLLAVLLLAALSVGGAFYLLKNRSNPQQFVAQKTGASTTTTISDNFDGASLDTGKWNGWTNPAVSSATIAQSGGKLVEMIPAGQTQYMAIVADTQLVTGDFEATVDLKIDSSGTGSGFSDVGLIFHDDSWQSQFNVFLRNDGVLYANIAKNGVWGDEFSKSGLTQPVTVRTVRIGDIVEFFYKNGAEFVPLGLRPSTYSGDGRVALRTSSYPPSSSLVTTGSFDNFTAGVNLVGLPMPTPGTPAACTLSFNVLATVPTPTPTPSGTPRPTPTPTPTPATPSPTPFGTSTPTPGAANNCGGTCGSNSNCNGGLFCYQGFCRSPQNPTSETCVGFISTPQPATPNPTPVILTEAGSVNGTWTVMIAGAALLLLGSIVMFAL